MSKSCCGGACGENIGDDIKITLPLIKLKMSPSFPRQITGHDMAWHNGVRREHAE